MEVLIREEAKNTGRTGARSSVLFTLLGRVIRRARFSSFLTALANERAFDEVPFVEGRRASRR